MFQMNVDSFLDMCSFSSLFLLLFEKYKIDFRFYGILDFYFINVHYLFPLNELQTTPDLPAIVYNR